MPASIMSSVILPIIPFPNIYWWSFATAQKEIILDKTEHFEKMTFRNRYIVAGADGLITLSIPLEGGRQQRHPMGEVKIDNKTNWQMQHWRTLVSLYNRSPYFEFYKSDLETLFQKRYDFLCDFNRDSIEQLSRLLLVKPTFQYTTSFIKNYPDDVIDIRSSFRSNQYNKFDVKFPVYQQTFQDRNGFFPNISMLDLLFAEGRNATTYLPKIQF